MDCSTQAHRQMENRHDEANSRFFAILRTRVKISHIHTPYPQQFNTQIQCKVSIFMKVGIHLITKTRTHTSGINNAGLGPVAFLIAVRISIFVRPARG